jgi:cellulose synthase/poly-beta-1,6-N-acetylglucosamine synthase-like glycosyltransferase
VICVAIFSGTALLVPAAGWAHLPSWIIFVISLAAISWAWGGYPAFLSLAAFACRRCQRWQTIPYQTSNGTREPCTISVIVAVHNEESVLPAKLANCLGFDYPGDKFEIIVATDGCRDRSAEIAQQFAVRHDHIRLSGTASRVGKSAAQNMAAADARGELLLFTDAATALGRDALQVIAAAFRQENVGCVTGRVAWRSLADPSRARSENLYWRYEHALWAGETTLQVLSCASGQCLAVRRHLFREIDPRFGDDVAIPLDVVAQGFSVVYVPALDAVDTSRDDAGAALRARTRMTLRSLTCTVSCWRAYRPWRRPGLCIAVISHKLLRWATPFLFLAVMGSAVPLAFQGFLVPAAVLAGQCCAIAAAVAGYLARRLRIGLPFAAAAQDFALENVGMMLGVVKALAGRRQLVYGEDQESPGPVP